MPVSAPDNKAVKTVLLGATLSLAASLSPVAANADQLADIQSKGEIVCGTIGTVPPFSFQNMETRTTDGYDVDICNLIAAKIGVKPVLKLVAGSARIPELNRGSLDIITGTLGWTEERAKQVDYSNIYNVSAQMVGVLSDSGIKSITELGDKRIAAQSSSTSEAAAKAKLPEAQVVTFQDVPQALLALKQKKVAGLALGELMLREFVSDGEGSLEVVGDSTLMIEKQGVGVRKGEDALLAKVNEILVAADGNGELDAIYSKWLGPDTKFKMTRSFKVEPIE